MWRNIVVVSTAFLLAGMLLAGCGRSEEINDMSSATPESYETLTEDGQGLMQSTAKEDSEDADVQSTAKEDPEEDTEEPERLPHDVYVDFSVIEENHEILEYDICAEPRYDWENTLLGEEEELRQDVEMVKKFEEYLHSVGEMDETDELSIDIHYFPFDFNDDGLEDYLVCNDSTGFFGSGGNAVSIYVQEEGGTLKQVLYIHDRLHQGDGIHERFTVLNEKTDGYYAIVLTSNHILRYDSDKGWYEFHEGE